MILSLDVERLRTPEQVRAFLDGSEPVDFNPVSREESYAFVSRTLTRFDYTRLGKPDRGLVKGLLGKATGLSRAQVTRLVGQFARTGQVVDRRRGAPPRPFERRYTAADIRLLAEVDATLGQMAGPATRAVMRRQLEVFGDADFARLAYISNGHLYNLRRSTTYRRRRTVLDKTRPTRTAIGERRPPRADGRPGFVRVDTVHQGDLDGDKGIYLINVVDEVTQFEYVGAVPAISERFLVPVLEGLLGLFPFAILGFHADNGSEYVNHRVAALLAKLHAEFTKSRPRHSNDNALVEGKNASVVRKWFGHAHIPRRFAPLVDRFAREVLSPALNFHRPCMFPVEHVDEKGRVRKRYPHDAVMTPYERLKSIEDAERFLKPGVTFEQLDRTALADSDLAAMRDVNRARDELFRAIGSASGPAEAA